MAPAWKPSFNEHDKRFLDELLDEALPAEATPTLLPDEAASATFAQAKREVEEVVAKRRALRDHVVNREGWRLEVITAPAAPLRPHGFDPMNMQPLTGCEIRHTRFLRLGGEAGTIECFGEALTEAAGAHPLFDGIARLVIPALAEPPVVTQSDDFVTVIGRGLQASFQGAVVTRATVVSHRGLLSVRLGKR